MIPFLDDQVLYALLQLGILVTFIISAVRAAHVSPACLGELLTAAIFGLLLEQGDILLFGTYGYNSHWVRIGDVPVAIALTWAMIIASAMNLSDVLGLPSVEDLPRPHSIGGTVHWLGYGALAPVADAIWAILLDLSLDAVAIRLRLWTWTIPADQGWFGVPWGNFYSWLYVAAMFSFFTRLVRRTARYRSPVWGWWQLAVPLLAYFGLLAFFAPYLVLQHTLFALDPENATWVVFAITLVALTILTVYGLGWARGAAREEPDHWLALIRLTVHLLFLGALVLTGLFIHLIMLLWVALTMLLIELVLLGLSRYNGFRIRTTRFLLGRGSRAE
ncbi:MAG: carotenoid biosynthesis protein [Anaerolineae bacterium]